METTNFAPHGLWARSMASMLQQIRDLGYNTIRVPFSNQLFDSGSVPNGIDYSQNPDLVGLNGIQILDKLIEGARARGLKIILDRHRPDAYGQSELWYTSAYSEARWIADWQMLARRYLNNDTVIGFDLHNEPHGRATWGDNNTTTDWRLAAERAGNAILAINPRLLIIVEGIERVGNDYYWWGGNLAAAGSNPVRLNVPNQLVYSAHDYPASVYGQSWFYASNYPSNLAGIWESHWAYLMTSNTAPVLLGEFGTRNQTTIDRQWLQTLANFMASRGMSFTYWSWNPNSGDTGGILQDDWRTVNTDKQTVLQPLLAPLIGSSGGGTTPQPPATPTGVTASAGNQQISLSWSASVGATSYNIYRGTSSNGQGATPYRTNITSTNFTDSSLTNGATLYYRVTAVNSVGESARSAEASATPSAGSPPPPPAGVSATAGDRQVLLRWSTSNGATSYNLYRGLTAGGQGATPYRTGLTGTSFTDTGLTNGTTYFYRLTAVNVAGESARSTEVSARPAAATSGGVTVAGKVASSSPYYSELQVLMANTAPVTALTIEIAVQRTPGVTYSGQYSSYWGGMMSMTNRVSGNTLIYTYTLNPGQSVPVGSNWLAAAQFGGNGTPHPTSGDTFTVTATSGGVSRTLTGTF